MMLKTMFAASAGIVLFATDALIPVGDTDFSHYVLTQGGLLIVVLVLMWAYRKDLQRVAVKDDEKLAVFVNLLQENTKAMARAAAASEATEKSNHRVARALERMDDGK